VGCTELERRGAVRAEDVLAWEARHGRIERGDITVFEFGWWRKWALRPDDVDFLTDWPGLGPDCVELLLERGVKAVGVDTLSPDVFGDTVSPVHRALLGEGVVIVENLANLSRLPPRFYLLALPLKIKGGTGAPCRATALVQIG
jgi:kynurenine formamidase